MIRKVYSYMRFSTPEQSNGHSLQRQADYAEEYVRKNGLVLDESLTMKDEGLSAYHQKHITKGALGVFYRAVEDGMVDRGSVLIVENIDRLSRANPRSAMPQFLNIINSGITVVIAKDGKEYSQESIDENPYQLFESLSEMMRANQESEYKSIRVKASIVSQIKVWLENGHGKIIRNGRDPYWVKPKEDKSGFDIIPEYVDVIKMIVDKFTHGWGYVKITRYLNENITHFTGNTWYMSYLINMLRSPTLIGERFFNVNNTKYIIPNYYPAILSEQEYFELQKNVNDRATTRSQQKIPSIITGNGICFCGHCGSILTAQNHKPRKRKDGSVSLSKGSRRINCNSKNGNGHCLKTSYKSGSIASTISAFPVECAMLEYCSDQMELSTIMSDNSNDKSLTIKAHIGELQYQASEAGIVVNNGESAMAQLLMNGEDVSAINKVVKEHQGKYDDMLEKIQSLEDKLRFQKVHKSSDLIDQWQSVKKDVHNLDEEARLLIRQIVKNTFKRIDIYFHSFHKSTAPQILKDAIHDDDNSIVMILTFTNDKTRILSIDRKSGEWVKGGDIEVNCGSVLSALAVHHVTDA